MAHMTHEEESAIDLNGNSYIIDFSAMQQVGNAICLTAQYPYCQHSPYTSVYFTPHTQINEDTGTTRSIRRTVVNIASSVSAARKDQPVEVYWSSYCCLHIIFVCNSLATKVFYRQIIGYGMSVDDHRVA